MNKKLALVIPALNESKTIRNVISNASNYGQAIVVDDGSTDDTGQIAIDSGAILVKHSVNQGYDYALASGIKKAVDDGYEFVITIDADGQHQAESISSILNRLAAGADMVIGIRDHHQRVTETLFSFVSRLLWKIQDPLCGLKGYKVSRLSIIKPLWTYNSVGTELALLGSRLGWQIEQIPIGTAKRVGASKFGNGIRANWIIFTALINGLLRTRVKT